MVKNLPAMQETPVQFLAEDVPLEKRQAIHSSILSFLDGLDDKDSACNLGDLGWEDPLEEDMATHSSILAWRISMDKGVWWATVYGVTKSQT